jgi:hypothetical protein
MDIIWYVYPGMHGMGYTITPYVDNARRYLFSGTYEQCERYVRGA